MRNASRCAPSLIVLVIGFATVGTLGAIAYSTGRRLDPEARFLDPLRAPTVDEASIAFAGEYATSSQEANDVVFLGDSSCRQGIDPVAFERLTGLRSYNLGTFGTAGPQVLFLIEQAYLLKHPRPKAVVICLTALSLEYSGARGKTTIPQRFLASYSERVDGMPADAVSPYASIQHSVGGGAMHACRAASSIVFRRTRDIRDVPLMNQPSETYRSLAAKVSARRGYFCASGQGSAVTNPACKVALRIEPEWDQNLRRCAETCEGAHVPVLILFLPLRSDVENSRDFRPLDGWVRDFRKQCPKAALASPVVSFYEPELCWDYMHLNAAGVENFMPLVAKDVQAALRDVR
jgi:hypothetical protein